MREFAKASEIKPGDIVEADAGFPCIPGGTKLEVKENEYGERYVDCTHGKHFIHEEAGSGGDGIYIGLYRVEG